MEKLATNTQEEKNLLSYESDSAFSNFHAMGLRDLERKLIEQYFTSPGGRTLDIGCGYGRTTKPLFDMGYNVSGIDISSRMIGTAKREYPDVDFHLMSATEIKFPNAVFDYALFSFNGLDYIFPETRRREALFEIFRVLKSGGRLILTSHNSAAIITHPRWSNFKTFWHTLQHGLLGSSYIVASYQGGDQVTFCRMPWLQKKDFQSVGFKVITVVGKYHTNSAMLNLFEKWPYFVLQKP